jgi:hypothetical protein
MNRWLFCTCFTLIIAQIAQPASAQFTDPRNYENTPIDTNQLEVSYTYVHANASIDASLVIAGARFNLNQGLVDYTRYFGLLHRMMWVEAAVPIANLSGSIRGTKLQGSTTGTGDSSYTVAMLLKGGPALTEAQFVDYQPTTTLGVSLTTTAPTGFYQPNKILNLGSNRWSFKPEIALSHPFGPDEKFEFDAYANTYFYTDNTSYRSKQVLMQKPLPGLEAHLSYSFNDVLWASLDARYSFHGTTFVDSTNQNNAQQNLIVGSEVNVALTARNSLLLKFSRAVVHQNGPSLTGFSLAYDYTWGKASR